MFQNGSPMISGDDVLIAVIPDIRNYAKACGFKYNVCPDDLFSECLLCGVEAIRKVDVLQMESPKGYVMRSATRGGLRKIFKSSVKIQSIPIEDEIIIDDSSESDHLFNVNLDKYMSVMTDIQRGTIFDIYFLGMTMDEAGLSSGRSRQAVSLSHKSAINKLRKKMGVNDE